MADKRAFAKFDVGYLDNPKMLDVLDSSLHAICMHFASVLYCSQHLTDGIVSPSAMMRKVGASTNDVEILIEAGLWHGPNHDCEPCRSACPDVPENRIYVHDFLEHNRDAAEAKRVSVKRSQAASARWEKEKAPMQSALHPALQNEPVCNAERERKRERKKEPTSSTAAPSKEFDSFWASYPRKIGKEAARKAFAKAITKTTAGKIMDGVEQLRIEVAGKDQQFTPHAATWLNAGRWDDEVATPAAVTVPSGYAWANR